MAFKNPIKITLALAVALSGLIGLSTPTFATQASAPSYAADGGSGGSSNNNTGTSVKCPNGSKRETAPTLAQCNLPEENANDALMPRVQMIINVVVGVVGVIAVAVIIIGGITFVTSQGDSAKVTKAKNTILYGIVGLIVALLAFAIVNFVLTGIFSPKP